MQDDESAIKIREMMHQLGFEDLDIYMEAVRLYELRGDKTMVDHYLQLLLEDSPCQTYTNTLLYTHCEWLKEVGKYATDPRSGFYEKFVNNILNEYRMNHSVRQSEKWKNEVRVDGCGKAMRPEDR